MIKKVSFNLFILCVTMQQALAAGDDGKKVDGLPQLDTSTYMSQVFWLVLVFLIMHIFFSKKSLPKISKTVENRSERIKNDIDSARRLREEVQAVQEEYEKNLEKARTESQNLFAKIDADLQKKSEQHEKKFAEDSEKRIADLESDIADARKKAIAEMSDAVTEIAAKATETIIGVKPDTKNVNKAVQNIGEAA